MDNSLIKLVALDLDGTLTEHRTRLENTNKQVLEALQRSYNLVIVGAGGCERIRKQMNEFPIDIIGNYGMEVLRYTRRTAPSKSIQRITVKNDRQSLLQRAERFRKITGNLKYWGEPVEFHESGMVTFPLLGTEAPIDEKLAFDRDRNKRRIFFQLMIELFPEFTVFIGGSSSYDLVPRPYNKLFALEKYLNLIGKTKQETIYFGDDWEVGGGDWHVKDSDIRFVEVLDYKDFKKKVEFLTYPTEIGNVFK